MGLSLSATTDQRFLVLNENKTCINFIQYYFEESGVATHGIAGNTPLDKRLLVKRIETSDQFFMADAGIGFWYNAYKIASLSDGDVVLFVPLALIGKYIQPWFLK